MFVITHRLTSVEPIPVNQLTVCTPAAESSKRQLRQPPDQSTQSQPLCPPPRRRNMIGNGTFSGREPTPAAQAIKKPSTPTANKVRTGKLDTLNYTRVRSSINLLSQDPLRLTTFCLCAHLTDTWVA